jgi:hypothetical protein
MPSRVGAFQSAAQQRLPCRVALSLAQQHQMQQRLRMIWSKIQGLFEAGGSLNIVAPLAVENAEKAEQIRRGSLIQLSLASGESLVQSAGIRQLAGLG